MTPLETPKSQSNLRWAAPENVDDTLAQESSTMTYSSTAKGSEKPAKPRPDFPLFAHATGRWAKKIRGKLHYFGKWADPDAALQRYVEERDDLYAGRKPRRKGDGLTIKDLVQRFLAAKKARVAAGELALGTFGDQYKTCKRVLLVFGGDRLVDDLAPDDFEVLRAQIAKTYGKLSRKVEIKRVRSIFRYAYEANLIDRSVRFGPGFIGPSRRELRCERQQNGQRMFEAAEIRAIVGSRARSLENHDLVGHQLRLRQYRRGESHCQEPGLERRLVQLPKAKDRDVATLPTMAGNGQGHQGSVRRAAGSS
jgi:hypothetical protein